MILTESIKYSAFDGYYTALEDSMFINNGILNEGIGDIINNIKEFINKKTQSNQCIF